MCFAVGFAPTFAENIMAGSFRDVAAALCRGHNRAVYTNSTWRDIATSLCTRC